jgi:hypothetical protein
VLDWILMSASKSMSGSMTIQSNSPLGPAMKPSRLVATCVPMPPAELTSSSVTRRNPIEVI